MSSTTAQPPLQLELSESTEPTEPKQSPAAPANQTQRIYYLDNLRAIAMLLGVFLHSAFAYANPAQTIWLATDPNGSIAIDVSIWFIHLFRMSLFFLLSGYFAKLVIERKGIRHFLWNRCLRIAVPFLLFYPFLLAAITVVFVFSLSYLEEPRGLMGMIAQAAKDTSGTQEKTPLSTLHLWFLYYLMPFSLVGAWLHSMKWLKLETLFRKPKLLLLCPLALIPAVMASGMPMPAPESFLPHWWPFAFYGLFFTAGWKLFGREKFLDASAPYVWYIVVFSMALFVPYYMLLPVLDLKMIVAGTATQSLSLKVVEAFLTAYLSVLLTVAALLLGQRYLASRSPFLSFIADSSYWVYLLHLPIVIFLQTLMIPYDIPLLLKFVLVLGGTVIPCMATYVVFVRYTPLGWLLHGKRSFP